MRTCQTDRQHPIPRPLKLTADKYIPFLRGLAEQYAATDYLAPEEISNACIKDSDALIIRTRTRVGRELLDGTKVRFVATATIGHDHIDTGWCEQHGICWTACPGCNSQAVCDYVEEALNMLHEDGLRAESLGIAGLGNVGSKVKQMAERRGMKVIVSDPPKGIYGDLTKADIITFHTPLTKEGEHRTFHLCDAAFLSRCKDNAVIINAARGGVVDEEALLKSGRKCIIDCWENEPDINRELLASRNTVAASYHIAGYSLEGKINATMMCMEAFRKFFSLPALTDEEKRLPLQTEERGDSSAGWLRRVTEALKARPADFEKLRKQYRFR